MTQRSMHALVFLVLAVSGTAVWGRVLDFDFDWRFMHQDFPNAMIPAFDDAAWQTLNVPHDWSARGPFRADLASGTGYAPGGVGWYRKHFRMDAADKDKAVAIEFDGVYNYSEVWINGQLTGRRPYGYASFQYDLTPYMHFGDQENALAVRVDHTRFADSRWYTGSGIYRHVRLYVTDKLHIGPWGTYVTTPEVTDAAATVRVETTVKNDDSGSRSFSLESEIMTAEGEGVASLATHGSLAARAEQVFVQTFQIPYPRRWSLENPTLYTLQSRIKDDRTLIDQKDTPFGIRTIRFDPNEGFFLNGQSLKLKGVCLHHDAGCLGAAVPDKVLERRLRLMKALGANAIRTSHNPPAPELLDLCDRLGLLVKDEAFDEFTPPKNKWVQGRNAGQPSRFGYGEVFTRWSVTDMRDMVRRDRNHPCIILWSIGNEIDYANDPFSHPVLGKDYRPDQPPAENLVKYARPLIEVTRQLDPTRPVTAALANITMSNAVGLPQLLDAVGYNYQEQHYAADHAAYPQRVIFGSENGDAYSAWLAVRDNDYVAGQFLWTGIDYLGEAGRWPNRANGAGLLDLCGFLKPIGGFRQSLWCDRPVVYICASLRRGRRARPEAHWNWQAGQTLYLQCYSNCPEVALSLNGQSLGKKTRSEAREGVLRWDIPYQAGTLKAVGIQQGRSVCAMILTTAGPAQRIRLSPDTIELRANGRDICHLVFQITDANGVRVPDAQDEIQFEIKGPGVILGIGNADRNNLDDPAAARHPAFQGRGLAVLQAQRSPGPITVTAAAEGLESATVTLKALTVGKTP